MSDIDVDMLLPDSPLDDPDAYALNFAPFAKRLADCVSEMIPVAGLVIAINGTWGSGKSTILNFVDHYLRDLDEDKAPIVVRFNPWWFTGREDLVLQFFDHLQRGLGNGEGEYKEVREALARLAGLVSKLPVPYLKEGGDIAKDLLKPKWETVPGLKEKIANGLKGLDRRVVVMIDDIDRLDKEEIRVLFGAIKGVADFPNVCYLMAFDRGLVAHALADVQCRNGEDYLAKIIQVPIPLPTPLRTALDNFLVSELNRIFRETSEELLDEDRFRSFYTQGIRHFIRTPRDVLRLVNSIAFSYGAVSDDVKCPDYVAAKSS